MEDPYSRARTHQVLLSDRVRTLAYRRAIEANVGAGDVVLDLGCGSGILSFFAARAGCRKVYAVERSEIIELARETARRNGLEGRIEFIRADLLAFTLPQRVDVALHELIGGGFWDEDLVRIVAHAREAHLKPGGRLLPYRVDLLLAPTSHDSDLERSVRFWSRRRYGFDFSAFASLAFQQEIGEALSPLGVDLHDDSSFLARPKVALRLDLRRPAGLPERTAVTFRLPRGRRLTGLVAFLRVHLDARRSFSTGPRRAGTHWGQVFLPAPEPRVLTKDAPLHVTLHPTVRSKDWRWSLVLG